ncbi:MAG: 3-carboxy-cis,cis-muconate cycloisomerase [Verrucomicrobia bacterium]|nr:3-carboxy-cis,cis-muconate cycloisomerase [Verrucomicrobiota bacterium]
MFSNDSMMELFSPDERLRSMLNFEAALARAEAKIGLIPAEAASTIVKVCAEGVFDTLALSSRAASAGNLAIPLLQELIAQTRKVSVEAARYIHMGATSQDVIDTGLVLQLRPAVSLLEKDVRRIEQAFAELAREHASTLLLGRTLLQPGPPIVFGLKAAGWFAAVRRGRQRLETAARKGLFLQFGGAVGTLSSLGDHGLAVAEALAAELELPLPEAPWHSHRDRVVELASSVAILVGSLGKIARDISLNMQPEIGELAEPAGKGRGGSSAMPHKRNPVGCMNILAAANRTPGLLSSLLSGMMQEHERGLGGWQAEWATFPEIFQAAAGATSAMVVVSEGLEVNVEAMRANLEATNGLTFSEALASALIPNLGRSEAHELVERLAEEVVVSGKNLALMASEDSTVTACLTEVELNRVFDPREALGSAGAMIDRLLEGEEFK